MRVSALVTLAAATLCYVVPSPASAMGTAFYHLADSNDEALKYELARSLAIELLGNARGLATATESLATEAARNLASARFVVAADAEADRQCAQVAASLFVLQTVPNTIYVCADTRWHVLNEPDPVTVLAQGFIHEAVHLAGITDECEATKLELLVMGRDVTSFANFHRYSKQCNGLLDTRATKRR